jgi:hypothetical protein
VTKIDGLRIGTALVVALLLSGCPGKPCPRLLHDDAQRAISLHRGMRRPLRVIRAEASVDQRGEQGRVRGTVMMFVERPDHVRFDAMTQFGPAMILTSDGARTDLRENRYLTGATCPSNISRLLGIRLSAEQVAQFLLGNTPAIEAEEQSIRCEDGVYRIVLRAADGRRQEIDYDVRDADRDGAPPERQHLRLVRSELFDAQGRVEWRATYEDYRVIPDPNDTETPRRGIAMPFRVRFEDPRRDADTLVRFETIDLNVEVPAEAFSQQPRPGINVEEVVCE